ncbi:MAG: GxxExxY protein [Flavobacteriales bacterium]|nr:GxxExxY protein [Flavobacteriales bacterium]
MARAELNMLTSNVLAAAIEVHKELGSGLLESIYEHCLAQDLQDRGLDIQGQVIVPVRYKGKPVGPSMKLDLLVEQRVIIEVKAVECLHEAHRAQLLTYLKLTGCKPGLLLNFNEALMKEGVIRVVNGDLDAP